MMFKKSRLFKSIASLLTAVFLVTSSGLTQLAYSAEPLSYLSAPGQIVTTGKNFDLPFLRGIKLDSQNPFKFQFIVDTGDSHLDPAAFKNESAKIIRYFLAALTMPEKDLWVNLSPDEPDQIIPQELTATEIGRDLLSQDYQLKQLLASLTYPESELGKKFWTKVYYQAQKRYGTTNIAVTVFNKVWVRPENALVYQDSDKAIIGQAKMEVMLEQDYLAKKMPNSPMTNDERTNEITRKVLRELILPIIKEEINNGEQFSRLRQMYYSLILAEWFKRSLKKQLLTKTFADQKNLRGLDVSDPKIKEDIYNKYLQAFKTGTYDYLKKEYDPYSRKTIKRQYFSGGIVGSFIYRGRDAMAIVTLAGSNITKNILSGRRCKIVDALTVAPEKAASAMNNTVKWNLIAGLFINQDKSNAGIKKLMAWQKFDKKIMPWIAALEISTLLSFFAGLTFYSLGQTTHGYGQFAMFAGTLYTALASSLIAMREIKAKRVDAALLVQGIDTKAQVLRRKKSWIAPLVFFSFCGLQYFCLFSQAPVKAISQADKPAARSTQPAETEAPAEIAETLVRDTTQAVSVTTWFEKMNKAQQDGLPGEVKKFYQQARADQNPAHIYLVKNADDAFYGLIRDSQTGQDTKVFGYRIFFTVLAQQASQNQASSQMADNSGQHSLVSFYERNFLGAAALGAIAGLTILGGMKTLDAINPGKTGQRTTYFSKDELSVNTLLKIMRDAGLDTLQLNPAAITLGQETLDSLKAAGITVVINAPRSASSQMGRETYQPIEERAVEMLNTARLRHDNRTYGRLAKLIIATAYYRDAEINSVNQRARDDYQRIALNILITPGDKHVNYDALKTILGKKYPYEGFWHGSGGSRELYDQVLDKAFSQQPERMADYLPILFALFPDKSIGSSQMGKNSLAKTAALVLLVAGAAMAWPDNQQIFDIIDGKNQTQPDIECAMCLIIQRQSAQEFFQGLSFRETDQLFNRQRTFYKLALNDTNTDHSYWVSREDGVTIGVIENKTSSRAQIYFQTKTADSLIAAGAKTADQYLNSLTLKQTDNLHPRIHDFLRQAIRDTTPYYRYLIWETKNFTRGYVQNTNSGQALLAWEIPKASAPIKQNSAGPTQKGGLDFNASKMDLRTKGQEIKIADYNTAFGENNFRGFSVEILSVKDLTSAETLLTAK